MPTPSNWIVSFGGKSYALQQEARRGTTNVSVTALKAAGSRGRAQQP